VGLEPFVTLVYAEEIAADPEILRAYAVAFADEDAATLVIYAPDRDADAVLADLRAELIASGFEAASGPKATLLCVPVDEGDAFLARSANVALSRRNAKNALAAIPHVGPGAVGLLRARAAGVLPEPSRKGGLSTAVLERVTAAAGVPDLADNVDLLRYASGMSAPATTDWLTLLRTNLQLAGTLEPLWDRLDGGSREILVSLLAYGVLGHRKVRMNVGSYAEIEGMARQIREHMLVQANTADPNFLNWRLDEYDLAHLRLPIRLHSHPRLLINEFMLDQYRAPAPADVAVRPGDVVIDGGGCWGETALHFAFLAGSEGRVHTFEFVPQNLFTMRRNLALNPELAGRITVHELALWNTPGEALRYNPNSGGTHLLPDGGVASDCARTGSIDALLASGAVNRVDFIKLDVEGSELAALQGAETALRRFRPRLAISAYHKPDDLLVLPAFIDGLRLGYRFAIGHFTMSTEETVLFAWPEADSHRQGAR
jgi:FkbM family methyltransferase